MGGDDFFDPFTGEGFINLLSKDGGFRQFYHGYCSFSPLRE
jgi:hypothetical protein